jgi:DNA-3-methyladenine glycosylase
MKRSRPEEEKEETKRGRGVMTELPKEFYARDTLEVTKDLIGKVMVYTRPDGTKISTIINEAEAYTEEEESCHAYRGKSERNRAMFMDAGHIYIYKIYGAHQCINFVTEHSGKG